MEALRKEFQISIEEYLAVCKERGITPQPPFFGKLNLRLGPDLHARVARDGGTERDEYQQLDKVEALER